MRSSAPKDLIGLLIGLLLGLFWSGTALAADSIRVGVSVSKTGPLAQFSAQVLRGLQMWVTDVNEHGALLGQKVELVVYDDASDPAQATARYQRLIAEGVDLLISPYSSPLTIAVCDALEHSDTAMVAIASAPQIWDRLDPRVFGIYTPADHNMDPFLDLLVEHGLTRVALVYQQSEFPRAVARGVREQTAQRNLKLVLDEGYAAVEPSFDSLVQRIKAAEPQAIIVGSYFEDAIDFAAAAHAGGVQTDLLAFSGAPALREFGRQLDPDAINGIISTVQWMRSVRMPGSFDFGFRYRQKHGTYPGYDAAGGYAAGQVLAAAVRLAGSAAPAAVRRELATMKFRSIIGHYRVQPTGLQTAKRTYLVQWQDTHISLIYPRHLARWQVLYPLTWNR